MKTSRPCLGLAWFVLAAPCGFADPVLLLSGELVKPGQMALDVHYQMAEDLRRYDSGASPIDFPAGEIRRMTRIPFQLRFGSPGGEEVVIKSSYWDATHRTSTAFLSKSGFADTLVLVRSFAGLWGDLRGGLGIGLKIPTGKTLYDVGLNEFPTGEGGWEGAASFAWADRRSPIVWHAEVTYYLGLPRSASTVMGKALSGEVRFGLSHRLEWGVGVEMKASDMLSVMGELIARNRFAGTGTYTSTGGDASTEIGTLAAPEYGADQQDHYWAGPLVQIQASTGVRISGGMLLPLRLTNGFGGPTYIIHLGTKL